jgi:hypothetical protein
MPHWTSSNTSTAPVSSQRLRRARRNSRPRSNAPPTPCTGSTTTAAVFAVICANPAVESRGMKVTSNGARGKPYHFSFAPQVSAPAPAVRPWKLCSSTTTSLRPGLRRNAIFSAFSVASAPLFTKNTLFTGSCENATRRCAARRRTSIGTALLWKLQACACSVSARVQPGWP